ncbi:MAG: hypothetical protein ACHQHN_04390 [Sphingobacteriales bacterium]
MFRKITSNRDPRSTLASELKKEFAPYHQSLRTQLKKIAQNYPKFLFAMMVINIILSVILVTTVFRRHPPKTKPVAVAAPGGFDRILEASAKLKKTINLKHTIDSLTQQRCLSAKDSLLLDSALDQFQKLKP